MAMVRGEKRPLPVEGAHGGGTGLGLGTGGSAQKKAREKMPDFDWSADNYALTWKLVEELRKPENKSVLFPDQENVAGKVRSCSVADCSVMDRARPGLLAHKHVQL